MTSIIRATKWTVRAGMLFLVGMLGACETLRDPLTVEPASRIPSEVAEVSAYAKVLSDGAIADFECAFNAYAAMSGLVGEEFIYAQQTASRTPYDRRNTSKDDTDYAINSCTNNLGVYTPLQVARASNENLIRLLNTWTDEEVFAGAGQPNRTNLLAIASAYAGYSYVLLGEGFCSMAVSYVNPDNTIDFGGEITRDSVFRLAVARFSEAIAAATTANNTGIRTLAHVGRARAKLNLGDYAGAKADAEQVPATPTPFVWNVSASDANTRRQNRIFLENSANNRSLSVGEPYRALNDPRVPVTSTTRVSATGIRHFFQTKYPTSTTPLPLATYEEAQLIIAEADIRSSALTTALPILNASRARGNQTPFAGTTEAEYLAELIDQRRRELFAESHHLGDVLRYDISLRPAAGTAYHFGGNYANQVCLPLPAAERQNNPKIGS